MSRALKWLGLVMSLATLTACASFRTPVADFDLEGIGTIVSDAGAELAGERAALRRLPLIPGRISPFPDVKYDGQRMTVILGINSAFLSGTFMNKSALPMQLRFDQASWSSNQQRGEMPIRVYRATVGKQFVSVGKKAAPTLLPATRLEAGARLHMLAVPAYDQIYPSGRLFNITFDADKAIFISNGVGNTLRLRVPVEQGEQRYTLVVEINAVAANARNIYF